MFVSIVLMLTDLLCMGCGSDKELEEYRAKYEDLKIQYEELSKSYEALHTEYELLKDDQGIISDGYTEEKQPQKIKAVCDICGERDDCNIVEDSTNGTLYVCDYCMPDYEDGVQYSELLSAVSIMASSYSEDFKKEMNGNDLLVTMDEDGVSLYCDKTLDSKSIIFQNLRSYFGDAFLDNIKANHGIYKITYTKEGYVLKTLAPNYNPNEKILESLGL